MTRRFQRAPRWAVGLAAAVAAVAAVAILSAVAIPGAAAGDEPGALHLRGDRRAFATPIRPAASVPPAAGTFLVAARSLSDPNFARSVVLLIHYDEKGASGVIVNRPTTIPVARAMPTVEGFQGRSDVVYLGGPVTPGVLTVLVRTAKPPASARQVAPGVYAVAKVADLETLLAGGLPAESVRVIAGMAGWAPRQLDAEIAHGGWHLRPSEARWVFGTAPLRVWEELLRLAMLPVA